MSEQPPDAALAALEQALAALAPAPGRLDRDQLMFRAGRASVPRRGWLWPATAAALVLLSSGLGLTLALRPDRPAVERIVYKYKERPAPVQPQRAVTPDRPRVAPAAAAPAEDPSPAATPHLRLQEQILRWGLDAVPDLPASPAPEPALTRERLLGPPAGGSSLPWLFPAPASRKPGDAS